MSTKPDLQWTPQFERLSHSSGPCVRLKFDRRTGAVLRDAKGKPRVAAVVEDPGLHVCGFCYQKKINRATAEKQFANGAQVLKCDECRLNGKLPKQGGK